MIPNQLIDKFKETIVEWLAKGEKPDYDFSRYCDGLWVILTNKRAIFAKEERDELLYLFDSKELLKDWRENGFKLNKYKTENILIYAYLLISMRVQGKDGVVEGEPKFSTIEEQFLRLLSVLPKEKSFNLIHKFINLLPFDMGAGYFYECLNLRLPLMAVMLQTEYNTAGILSDPLFLGETPKELSDSRKYFYTYHRFFLLGEVCLIQNKYSSSRRCFQELIEADPENDLCQAKYNWALGLEQWKKDNPRIAVDCFEKAKNYFRGRGDEVHSKLMEFLKSSVLAYEEVKPYDVQMTFLLFADDGETNNGKEKNGDKPETLSIMKEEMVSIKECLGGMLSSLKNKPRLLKPKEKSKDAKYEVWLPNPERDGWVIHEKNIPYSICNAKYLQGISKYKLFVNETKGQVFFGKKETKEKLKDGIEVPLIRDISLKILCRFLRKGGIAGTAQQIYSEVWTYPCDNTVSLKDRVEQQIKILRKKIKPILLGIENSGGIYRFSKYIEYCLIQEEERIAKKKSIIKKRS